MATKKPKPRKRTKVTGKRVRDARLAADLTQAELAKMCHVAFGSVTRWEHDGCDFVVWLGIQAAITNR